MRVQKRTGATRTVELSSGRLSVRLGMLLLVGCVGLLATDHAAATTCAHPPLDELFEHADVVAEFWIIDVEPEAGVAGVQRFRVRLGRVFKGAPALTPGAEVDVLWSGFGASYAPIDVATFVPGSVGFFRRQRGGLVAHPCTEVITGGARLPPWLTAAPRAHP